MSRPEPSFEQILKSDYYSVVCDELESFINPFCEDCPWPLNAVSINAQEIMQASAIVSAHGDIVSIDQETARNKIHAAGLEVTAFSQDCNGPVVIDTDYEVRELGRTLLSKALGREVPYSEPFPVEFHCDSPSRIEYQRQVQAGEVDGV